MANLPADLPENWTQGQIISPNGTEVGLTEQHGYNYLMQQVNAAQTAINNIVAGLTDVAQETSVQEIIANIGNTDDTGGSSSEGTSMAKLNYLIESLKTILNSTTGTAGLKTLDKIIEEKVNAAVSTITSNGGIKVVKSVQRGVVEFSRSGGSKTVSISSVDTSKAIVLINNETLAYFYESSSHTTYGAILESMTNTSIILSSNRISGFNDFGGSASWQVIEFY